jgi:hypothetical protein
MADFICSQYSYWHEMNTIADVTETVIVTRVDEQADPPPHWLADQPSSATQSWQLSNVLAKLGLEDTPEHRDWIMYVSDNDPSRRISRTTRTMPQHDARGITVACDDRQVEVAETMAGERRLLRYFTDGRLHHPDAPAVTTTCDGRVVREEWYCHGITSGLH